MPVSAAITLASSSVLSLGTYVLIMKAVPSMGPVLISKGFSGRDMLKASYYRKKTDDDKEPTDDLLPESIGLVAAAIYILMLAIFAPLPYLNFVAKWVNPDAVEDASTFPYQYLNIYLASLLSLLSATFLGFLDDLFDIRWRYKLPIPIIASIPLLITYFSSDGITDILIPDLFGLRSLFSAFSVNGVVHLGSLYYVYMSLLALFCTNSINILAGVNGVEVGQAFIIALSIALNDLLYLDIDLNDFKKVLGQTGGSPWPVYSSGFSALVGQESVDRHLFSLYLMLPFIATCIALMRFNWFPANAFVGDTFCYFAGMAFAVVGITCHFSKTLLLFFIPQIFNFLFSVPQLFRVVPCPRHRLPVLDLETNYLKPSFFVLSDADFASDAATKLRLSRTNTDRLLKLLSVFGLVLIETDPQTGHVVKSTNFTLINYIVVNFGPVTEEEAAASVMFLQCLFTIVAFAIRYGIADVMV